MDSLQEAEPCRQCGGRGWYTADVPVGHPDFGSILTCECQQPRRELERSARLLRYSNLEHLARFTFKTLDPEGKDGSPESQRLFREAYEEALRFADRPSGWLVLTGPYGSGKTHLAAAIGNACIERDYVVLFVHVPDLLDHLRATFVPSSEISYSDLFEQVKTVPLLMLDDLGSESATPWAQEKLRQIINQRYGSELPTVTTVSGELDDVDPYILSRMRAPRLSKIIHVGTRATEQAHRLGRVEPALLRRMTFETFDVRSNNPSAGERASLEAAYQAAKVFAAEPDGWLTLFGDTGVGKTHLAVAIAAERTKAGQPVFFTFVPELLDYLRFTYSPESKVTHDHVLEEVKNTPLLILDDLGREQSTPWAVEKLYQIIVHRHNTRAPTVITSEIDFTADPTPISSRILDMRVGESIRIDAPDYRNVGRNRRKPPRAAPKRRAPR